MYTREIGCVLTLRAGTRKLQWGPGLYTREIAAACRDAAEARRFNGARVCTPGKYGITAEGELFVRASMGPGFVHPGNLSSLSSFRRDRRASMGPGFVHPGNLPRPGRGRWRSTLQWGPGLYTREMSATSPGAIPTPRFNGARVCTPGKFGGTWSGETQRRASMGPGFVHPGNRDLIRGAAGVIGLQWGPGLYTREIARRS